MHPYMKQMIAHALVQSQSPITNESCRRPGRMVLEEAGGGVAVSLDVEAYNFQDLINLVDRAARLLGAN
jgi:hypothetical protein